jgi:hypothetical protein
MRKSEAFALAVQTIGILDRGDGILDYGVSPQKTARIVARAATLPEEALGSTDPGGAAEEWWAWQRKGIFPDPTRAPEWLASWWDMRVEYVVGVATHVVEVQPQRGEEMREFVEHEVLDLVRQLGFAGPCKVIARSSEADAIWARWFLEKRPPGRGGVRGTGGGEVR